MKKKIFALCGTLLAVIGLYLVWNYGYIEVRLQPGNASTDATIELLNQSDDRVVKLTNKNNTVKKLVHRGSYEVLVRQGETSFLSITKSGGWLQKTSVEAVLSPENLRQFIGDNPGPCATYNKQVLITYGCTDSFKNTLVHEPATKERPSYTQKPTGTTDGTIEGIIQTSEGTVAVLKRLSSIDRDSGAAHTAYLINDKNQLVDGVALKGLDDSRTYTVYAYRQGLLLYNGAAKMLYFPSRKASPQETELKAPDKMNPYAFSVNGGDVVVAYVESGKKIDPDNPKSAAVKGQATIITNDKSKNIPLKKRYSSITTCGTNRLCGLLNKRLEILDVSGDKSKLLFTLTGVDQIESVEGHLLVVRGKEILSIDTEKHSGSITYSFGNYTDCGLLVASPENTTGFTACIINSRSKKEALLLDITKPNTDSIDKKIAELSKVPEVKSLSVYTSYITLTPNAGKTVYDPSVKEFRYPPDKVQAASAVIEQTIDRLGINRSAYTITNTLKN